MCGGHHANEILGSAVGLMLKMVLQAGMMVTTVTTEASRRVVCVVRRPSVRSTVNVSCSVW